MKYILLILVWCICNTISAQEKIIYKGENHLLIAEGNCMIVYDLLSDIFDEERELTIKDYKRRYRKAIRKNRFLTHLSPIEIVGKFGHKTQIEQLLSYEQIDSVYQNSPSGYYDLQGFQGFNLIILDTVYFEEDKGKYIIQFHNGLDWLCDFFTVQFRFKFWKVKDLKMDKSLQMILGE